MARLVEHGVVPPPHLKGPNTVKVSTCNQQMGYVLPQKAAYGKDILIRDRYCVQMYVKHTYCNAPEELVWQV